MDFTIQTYNKLMYSLQRKGYSFITFSHYIEGKYSTQQFNNAQLNKLTPQPNNSVTNQQAKSNLILRHDVDAFPQNSLEFAHIQAELGISGTYYFRMVPQSFDETIIKEIVDLGHEVGYHYETMDTCKGNVDKAYYEFCCNLEKFQKITPIRTISMHGSPMSPYDNREIWKKYDYKKYGIIAEPYFDINFNELFYITDTGRRWDGHLYNIRDKATNENPITNPDFLNLRFHSTHDIIKAVQNEQFPKQAMLNFHPQRWNDKLIPWLKEFMWQNIKNQGKRMLVSLRK
ncbi:MAG: hypothetical protein EBX50_16035 [Chitinophagia bacterium]|nr:hypothetical protein [Chitinophagia bacterium]